MATLWIGAAITALFHRLISVVNQKTSVIFFFLSGYSLDLCSDHCTEPDGSAAMASGADGSEAMDSGPEGSEAMASEPDGSEAMASGLDGSDPKVSETGPSEPRLAKAYQSLARA